ncbi:DUF6428 family protein [Planctomicrobium sp. SH668]|uniref:DUF6428 family protein n=1 Tax=Planctomicrobium sp. SH668 TaxID=3448126 RepID=UPI003F5BCFA9
MKLSEFLNVLTDNPFSSIQIVLPNGSFVPPHFHVTEVGRVQKDFIDCGGTVRSVTSCVLQTWFTGDVDHRLDTTKLHRIIQLAAPVLRSEDLEVEIEHESTLISQYPLISAEATTMGLVLRLGTKHTACLAEDLCVVLPVEEGGCCGPTSSGCC